MLNVHSYLNKCVCDKEAYSYFLRSADVDKSYRRFRDGLKSNVLVISIEKD